MPRLKLFLLGAPQVELDGALVDLHSHKALALFAYLAVTNQPHSRAKLATLFWPDQGESRALAYLRHTLWTIRKALGEAWLDGEQEWIALHHNGELWVDVLAFQQQLTPGDLQLEAAVQLYRDDFLVGFSLRDSPAFDEWHFFQSEQLRQQLAGALQQLIQGKVAKGDFQAAIPYARRWLALDPMHEPAHQALLQLYAWGGQRAAAVRQYRECRRILREELNVNPNAETQALYQQLQTGGFHPPQPHVPFSQAKPINDASAPPSQPKATPPQEASHRYETPLFADELRFVTLLSVGLCHESAAHDPLAEPLAPDLLAEQTERLLTLVRHEAATYLAQIEPVMGGSILVLFGANATHEDDGERALQVALAILQHAQQQQLPVSIGGSSGLVYVGAHSAEPLQRLVLGSVVLLATRIQARLAAGECGVSNSVFRQTQGSFRFQPRPLQLLEQDAPLTIYQLHGKQPAPRKQRGIAGLHAQLVGRSEELFKLQTLAAQARHGNGQIAAIIGEAGIGKSRLALEFHAQLPSNSPPWLWLEGRCLEMTQGSSYAPFMAILRAYWGWRPEESDATRAATIRSLLAELYEDHCLVHEQVSEIGAVLGRLLGLHFENDWDRRLEQVDVHELQRRTVVALSQFFAALSYLQPIILVLDDLHWADLLSLELIHQLLESLPCAALLLLCIYRPEQQRRSWQLASIAAQKRPSHFCQIELHDLTPDQSRLMIANLLQSPSGDDTGKAQTGLWPALQQLILEQAQGNPLYLEELIYSLIDRGLLVRQSEGWHSVSEIKLSAVPESLQSLIYTRLDALGSPWKQVLQRAAVIGRTFHRHLLALLMLPDLNLDDAIQRLIDARFIYQERLFPEEEYSFRHVLVQDAIYHGLTQRQQRQLHRQVAQSIEQLAGTRVHEQIDLLAHHWSQSGELKKAIHYLLLAGDKAYAALAYREAANYYRRALGFLQQQTDQSLTARTLMKLGNSYHSAGEYRRARQAFDDCFALDQQVVAPLAEPSTMTHTLRLAWGEPYSIDPIYTGGTNAIAVVQQLFSPLVQIGASFEIMPAVAQRWEILQGGRRYIFHLRSDVQWSDGAPVTAHDYALTLRRILAPTNFDNMASLFFAIKNGQAYHHKTVTDSARLGIVVANNHTLIIDLEQPASYFLQSLTCAAACPTPAHLFAAHGEQWVAPNRVVANGPFQLLEWQPGHSLILQRNPLFFGQTSGNVGRIELFFDLSTTQQTESYESGQLDVLWLNDMQPSERELLRRRHPNQYRTSPLLNVIFAALDVTQPPFNDCRVRQAFIHAVDREALVNRALGGYEQPAHGGFIPIGLPGHSPTIGLGFDPAHARFLLQEAGYKHPTQFPEITAFSWQGTQAVCDALSEQWQRHLGVTISWRSFTHPDFLRHRYEERPVLFLFGWACDYPDASLFLDMFVNGDLVHWSNFEFQRLFAQAQQNLDTAQRLSLLAQADALAMAEAAVMPLYYERLQMLIKPQVLHYPLAPFRWWFWKDVLIEL